MPRDTQYEDIRAGNEAAFSLAYGALNPSLLRLAHAITGSRATAEEVAQETWMTIIDGDAGFKHRASFKNWVFAILSNKARNRARRDGRTVSLEPEGSTCDSETEPYAPRFNASGRWSEPPRLWDEITPERVLAGRQVLHIVQEIIQSLPAAQQAILDLLEKEKLTSSEIGDLLDLSEGNVRVHLHRARETIRRELERHISEKK